MDYPPKDPPPPYGMNVPTAPPPVVHVIVPQQQLGPSSQPVTCPSCHTPIHTRVDVESSMKTHLVALLLCFICCPVFWLPYCCDTCQSTNHYCPKCNAFLGSYNN